MKHQRILRVVLLVFCFQALFASGLFSQASMNGLKVSEFEISHNPLDFYLNHNITDGPYIFFEGKETLVKWIENDQLVVKKYDESTHSTFTALFKVFPDGEALKKKKFPKPDYKQNFQEVNKVIALSDIHGQYDLFVELLVNHKVMDKNGNWSYGNGHLLIDGDIFDRGPQVTEVLWLVYHLEIQAEKVGGKVHFTLGNHEKMVLEKDLRYIHEKYTLAAQLMDTSYNHLHSASTFLGRWLRTKPVMLTINDVLFVHAGISPKFIAAGLTPQKANKHYLNRMVDEDWEVLRHDSISVLMDGNDGPFWYRGYFRKEELTGNDLDGMLAYFGVNHIVVGHTSQKAITTLFKKKVIGIDSSIKNGKGGEVLIIEEGVFFRGQLDGGRTNIKE